MAAQESEEKAPSTFKPSRHVRAPSARIFGEKIVCIGTGNVGSTFVYCAALNDVAEVYGLLDPMSHDVAEGHSMDIQDIWSVLPTHGKTRSAPWPGLELMADADILVITAGKPKGKNASRLDLTRDNAKIMKGIAENVKKSGFMGISIIISNPCDVMAAVYQKITGFAANRVISSGCSLDTSRLRYEIADIEGVAVSDVSAFVIGEHGDSSVCTIANASVSGIPINKFDNEDEHAALSSKVKSKAYEIAKRKRATYFGVATCTAMLCKCILRADRKMFSVGKLLDGEYGEKGVYASVPCVLSQNGIEKSVEFPLSGKELDLFRKSCAVLREYTKCAFKAIEE